MYGLKIFCEISKGIVVYGFKILCEISKVSFEISDKIFNPYTVKYAFDEVLKIWRLKIS